MLEISSENDLFNPSDEEAQAEGLVVDRGLGLSYVGMEDDAGILNFSAELESCSDFIFIQGSQAKEDLQQVPFTNFVTFGDSLADVGNVFLSTEETNPPSPPYFNGRFSNGKLVVEILAKKLGLSASTPSLAGGDNYAFGSAETGSGNSDQGFPNVGEQINFYLATDTPTPTDIFFISAGSNNFFPDTNVQTVGENIPTPESVLKGLTDNIITLANAGAENFVIPNLVSLGTLPFANAAGISDELNAASTQFNTLLDSELDELEDELGINITELDVAHEVTKIQANPSDFGLTNIDTPALNTTTGVVVPNPDEYFWWDDVHPTATAYSLIAQGLVDDIPNGITQFAGTNTSPLAPDVEGLSISHIPHFIM